MTHHKHPLNHPIIMTDQSDVVKKEEVGKGSYYSANLAREDDPIECTDDMMTERTDIGGTIDRTETISQDTVGSVGGTPGHPGTDADTE